MAAAITTITGFTRNNGSSALLVDVMYSGSDVLPDGTATNTLVVDLSGDQAPQVVRTLVSAAVTNAALEMGFSCIGANILIPSFQKG